MDRLDSETEELLKEILENDKNFPECLRNKFSDLNNEDDSRLRAKIKVLSDEKYISLKWADNVPYLGRIEQKGKSYFTSKEQEETKDFIEQKKRVFISHSSKDSAFVGKLEQLIKLLGVKRENIFCSSIEGQGVKIGTKIEEAVRKELIEDKVIIYILSNNFFNSTYCIYELGAGWILSDKRIQDKNLFLIKLPDVSFDDIKGFIGGSDKYTECTDISITAFIEEFEKVLQLNHKPPTEYLGLVKNFIEDIEGIFGRADRQELTIDWSV